MKSLRKVLASGLLALVSISTAHATATPFVLGQTVYDSFPGNTCAGSFSDTHEFSITLPVGKYSVSLVSGAANLSVDSSGTNWAELQGTAGDVLDVTGASKSFTLTTRSVLCGDTGAFSFRVTPVLGGVAHLTVNMPSTSTAGGSVFVVNESGMYGDSKVFDENGVATIDLPADKYNVFVSSDTGIITSYSGSPYEKAGLVTLNASQFKTLTAKLADAPPTVTNVTNNNGYITITGTGFGTKKGYLDFDGYITNSASVISSWSNTSISARLPAQADVAGFIRVSSIGGGWSSAAKQY